MANTQSISDWTVNYISDVFNVPLDRLKYIYQNQDFWNRIQVGTNLSFPKILKYTEKAKKFFTLLNRNKQITVNEIFEQLNTLLGEHPLTKEKVKERDKKIDFYVYALIKTKEKIVFEKQEMIEILKKLDSSIFVNVLIGKFLSDYNITEQDLLNAQ